MDKSEMRKRVSEVYRAQKWRDKVAKMSDAQLLAIYLKFVESGKVK